MINLIDHFSSHEFLVLVQVLAATQTPGEAGMNWFQGTADAVRQFTWLFEVCDVFDFLCMSCLSYQIDEI